MKIDMKLFAVVRDAVGTGETTMQLPDCATVSDAVDALVFRYPVLADWKPFLRVAVNQTYAALTDSLHDSDEVAVIPPVSGG